MIFGRTEALRTAFEEASPKTVATLQSVGRVELPETPSHVRFSANEELLVLALPQKGILVPRLRPTVAEIMTVAC